MNNHLRTDAQTSISNNSLPHNRWHTRSLLLVSNDARGYTKNPRHAFRRLHQKVFCGVLACGLDSVYRFDTYTSNARSAGVFQATYMRHTIFLQTRCPVLRHMSNDGYTPSMPGTWWSNDKTCVLLGCPKQRLAFSQCHICNSCIDLNIC